MTINKDVLELLERRMAETVEARVRRQIMQVYGTILVGVLGAFSIFGYDTLSSTKEAVIVEAQEAVEETTKDLVENATELAVRARAEMEVTEEFRRNAQARLNATLRNVEDVTANIESTLLEIQENLKSAESDVDAYRERSSDLFLSASYEEIIRSLAEDMEAMTNLVESLHIQAGLETSSLSVLEGAKATLETVLERTPEVQPGAATTIFSLQVFSASWLKRFPTT